MLNLEDTLFVLYYYNIEKDLYLKLLFYIFPAILFLDLLRNQISEIELLQIVPGSYLFLIFLSLILLIVTSNAALGIPFDAETKTPVGNKTVIRLERQTRLNLSICLLLGFFIFSLNTIIPIGLDSFDSYDYETLSNLWSFEEVLTLESVLVTVLITLSQVPIFFVTPLHSEEERDKLPRYWKNLSFFTFVFAGFVTPTIDGYTQISLSLSALSLYAASLVTLEKRVSIKFSSISSLNF